MKASTHPKDLEVVHLGLAARVLQVGQDLQKVGQL